MKCSLSMFSFCVVALVLVVSGCNQPSGTPEATAQAPVAANAAETREPDHSVAKTPAAADGAAATHAPSADEALSAHASPETVVTAFLEATRRGDDALAAQLLSRKALDETKRVGLAVKPPGTPSMRYTISRVELPGDIADGAYVHSTWTEKYEDGEEQFDVTWILRKQAEGWRVVGMAAQLEDDQPPFLLNFEQPEDLYRRVQEGTAESDLGAEDAPHVASREHDGVSR